MMLHMGFVHAVLVDFAEGRDGSSWDRERRLADALIETSSRFDAAFEPLAEEPVPSAAAGPPRGGIGEFVAEMFGRAVSAR